MAEAFPQSKFVGFDYHAPSIEQARKSAAERGLKNVDFEVAPSKAFPARGGYDLVAFFDCLHDMGDPAGAAAHVRSTLKPDGSWMIVEPFVHRLLRLGRNEMIGTGDVKHQRSRDRMLLAQQAVDPDRVIADAGIGIGAPSPAPAE